MRILIFLMLFSLAIGNDQNLNSNVFPRPLIIEYGENNEPHYYKNDDDEVELRCMSWRFAVEANNLSPWKTVPEECGDYVRGYVLGPGYKMDIDRVSSEAEEFAKSLNLGGDGKDVWVFDVDETLLSNLPYYSHHGYGSEVFDPVEFDKWVEKGTAPALESSLKLYQQVLNLGFKVFLLTGRSERHRSVTVENLMNAGFRDWDKLILRITHDQLIFPGLSFVRAWTLNMSNEAWRRERLWTLGSDDHGKTATTYKSERRNEMVEEGFRIVGNSGDQWSDLLGSSMSNRSFKLPNPIYYIP